MKKLNKIFLIIIATLVIFFSNKEIIAQLSYTWEIRSLNNPAPGFIWLFQDMNTNYSLIDNYGINQFKDSVKTSSTYNLVLLKNGLWLALKYTSYLLYDNNFNVIDSIQMPEGYFFDFHDCISLNNGHYLILFNEYKNMDMSKIVPGGKPDATIKTNAIMEMDTKGNIYWEWHALDHLNIQDATEDLDLTQKSIDFPHINTLFEDETGNIMVSFRHLDEVSMINKSTKEFIWRFGGSKCKNNQFTITNDEISGFKGFSHQHSVSLSPEGNLLMFDNGNMKPVQYSRPVEYHMDFINKKATKIWEYNTFPALYNFSRGSAIRLPNGNTLVNYAGTKLLEIKPDNTIALDILFSFGTSMYRVEKYIANMNSVSKNVVAIGDYTFNDTKFTTGVDLTISSINSPGLMHVQKYNYAPPVIGYTDSTFSLIYPYRWVISAKAIKSYSGVLKMKVSTILGLGDPNKVAIYYRPNETRGDFIELKTTYNSNTDEISANVTNFGEYILASKSLNKPSLVFPTNNEIGIPSSGTVKWTKQIGAKKYQFQLSKTNTFDHIEISSTIDNNLEYDYQGLSYYTKYFWRVRAINDYDTSEWSNVFSFSTGFSAPKLISPINKFVGLKLTDTLSWSKVEGAAFYWIQIAKNQEFSNLTLELPKVENNYIVPTGLELNTKYFWRVIAYNKSDTSSWTPFNYFTTLIDAPKLFSPSKDTVNVSVNGTLSWIPVSDADNYNIEVSQNISFDTCEFKVTKFVGSKFSYTGLKYGKTYYWRVKAIRKTDESNWSDYSTFTTLLSAPILLAPANGDLVKINDVRFQWTINDTSKVSYRIQMSKNIDFTNIIFEYSKYPSNRLTMYELPTNSTIYWRVMVFNGNMQSDWSTVWIVKTGNGMPIDIPTLVSPTNNSETNNYGLFTWSKVSRAYRYRLQVSLSNNFSNLIIDSLNYGQTSYSFSYLSNSKTYYWRVKAYSVYDSSSWSNTWSINIAKLSLVKLISPRNEQLSVPLSSSLSWRNINEVQEYYLQISDRQDFSNLITDKSINQDTIFNFTNLNQYTQYFWRVKYKLNGEVSNWTSPRTFTTESKVLLGTPSLVKPSNYQSFVPVEGTLTWSTIENAKSYRVEISDSRDFEPAIYTMKNITDTMVTYSGLDFNQTYYWRVSAFNESAASTWSNSRAFTTELPSPTNLNPLNNSVEIPVIGDLTWDIIHNIDSYYIQLSDDSTFTNNTIFEKVYEPMYSYTLVPFKTYYWRVFSYNFGNYSSWTSTYNFTTSDMTDVNDNDWSKSILTIYPNPTSELLHFNDASVIGSEFKLYDLEGNKLMDSKLINNFIDVSNLCSGSYYIVLNGNAIQFIKN